MTEINDKNAINVYVVYLLMSVWALITAIPRGDSFWIITFVVLIVLNALAIYSIKNW